MAKSGHLFSKPCLDCLPHGGYGGEKSIQRLLGERLSASVVFCFFCLPGKSFHTKGHCIVFQGMNGNLQFTPLFFGKKSIPGSSRVFSWNKQGEQFPVQFWIACGIRKSFFHLDPGICQSPIKRSLIGRKITESWFFRRKSWQKWEHAPFQLL